MGKLLVLIALAAIAVWLLKRALQRPEKEAPPQKAVEGDLVACARCGLNLPRDEARSIGPDLYCSDEHAHLGRQDSTSGRS